MVNKDDLNERLEFGTDEFYNKLREEIPNAESDSQIYSDLYSAIENDVMPHIFAESQEHIDLRGHENDILHEVYVSVYKGLPIFLNNPDYFPISEDEWSKEYKGIIDSGEFKEHERNHRLVPPEIRRQSWLSTITSRRISDYRKKLKKENGTDPGKKEEDVPESLEVLREIEQDSQNEQNTNADEDVSAVYNGTTDAGEEGIDRLVEKDKKLLQEAMDRSADKEYEKRIPSHELVRRLKQTLSLDSEPERIMGFVFSCMIIPLKMGKLCQDKRVRSGKPTMASEYLKGKTLGTIFKLMKIELDEVLGKELPDSIYSKLESELEMTDDKGVKLKYKKFNLSPNRISDASHRLNDKIDGVKPVSRNSGKKDDNSDESDDCTSDNNGKRR